MTGTRTLTVAVLVTGALTAVLVAWFGAGWRAAGREREGLEARARAEGAAAAAESAAAVVTRLEELRATESQRPYFHYQNLFHDPRGASEGRSVVPSPLAGGPLDPLVAIHFQFDARGTVTAPTVNEEVPDNVAGPGVVDRALLASLANVRGDVVTPGDPIQIAMAAPAPREVNKDKVASVNAAPSNDNEGDGDDANGDAQLVAELDGPQLKPSKPRFSPSDLATKKGVKRAPAPEPKQQVVALDPDAYAQNNMSNQIFVEAKQRQGKSADASQMQQALQQPQPIEQAPQQPAQQPVQPPIQGEGLGNGPDVPEPPQRQRPRPRPVVRQKPASPPSPPAPVLITVAPLAWRVAMIDGQPALLAVRQVTTPDGVLTQGLVVDRAEVEGWLADRGGPVATIVTGPVAGPSAAISLGGVPWRVAVDADLSIASARTAGAGLERAFLGRFVPVSALAALCAMLVVLLTARAERLAQQRARFAAAAAHELRTPLAGIQLYGDMLADGLGDPSKARDYAKRMAEEASRLGRVVSNVLGFSQLERGSLAVRAEASDLSAAVQAIVERAEPALTRAGSIVELDAPPGIRARFDADALARIVGNLLDNAEKYSREHADRTIAVTVRPGPEQAEIVVVDHGPGLPAALRRRRFRPFARGTGDDGPPGLGLGLALSQNLATAMGGALSWRDRADGAEFVVTVPMASPADV